ncbi:hypothetical protein [Mesorhizobium sp. DCY119]|uniref:hypothetical protein n=1 Tax=Mesorhizobium sp. DCY119 TaxID=2108445 RepID=UPI000E6B8CDB|nr:hypothetical protein [Mesorhizobium sp. DCY119]RJG45866.1 hypothetical protein D3Y55_17485 [Mesorhizobium sp. DCY119]
MATSYGGRSAADFKEDERKRAFEKHVERTRQQIVHLQKKLADGSATGVPMDTADVQAVGRAAGQSLSQRYNPATTVRGQDGRLWTAGVGAAPVPAMPDLLTRDDWERDQKEQQRYAKVSNRLWNAYRTENPYADPAAVQKAVSLLVANSGMSLSELSDLGSDELSRPALFARIDEAVGHIHTLETSGDTGTGEDLRTNVNYGAGAGVGRSPEQTQPSADEQPTSMSGEIAAWQRKTGFTR